MLNIENQKFLSEQEIRSQAPSIYSKKAAKNVSDHYVHIPTSQVISDMEELGWKVSDAKEVKARKRGTIGYQKHLVVFRNPDITIEDEGGDHVFPQILLTNSHDGKNAFVFTAGLFRLVCENGLVISSKEFENIKLRHMGYSFEELQSQIKLMVEKLPLTVESMNAMRKIELEEKQIEEFAKRAVTLRFSEDQIKNIEIDFEDLVTPVRVQDQGNDLWSVYNVLQEKLIKGNFEYSTGVKSRKARKIKNFTQDFKLNQELFELALEYVN